MSTIESWGLEGLSLREKPNNLQLEQAVLGSFLARSDKVIRIVGDILDPKHFYDPMHGRIYKECWRRATAGEKADAFLLKEWFASDPDAPSVKGPAYLALLLTCMVSFDTVKPYAEAIRDLWVRRSIIAEAVDLVEDCYDFARPVALSAAARVGSVQGYATIEDSKSGVMSFNAALDGAIRQITEAQARGGHNGIIIPQLPRLNSSIIMPPKEFTILGGVPGAGKSALGWQIGLSTARHIRDRLDRGTPIGTAGGVVGISLEMSAEAIGARALAAAANVSAERVRKGLIGNAEADLLILARRELGNLPIEMIAVGGLTPTTIKMRLRQAQLKFGGRIALIIIDHVQLVNPEDKDTRSGGAWATGRIADALLGMGKEFDAHVLALSQLDLKDILRRPDKMPTQADLRWSANWAQNADNILFVHRPEMFESVTAPEREDGETEADHRGRINAWQARRDRLDGRALVIVSKVRSGSAGYSMPMTFVKETMTFVEAEQQNG